jgi:hypothetical protein
MGWDKWTSAWQKVNKAINSHHTQKLTQNLNLRAKTAKMLRKSRRKSSVP